MKRRIVPLHFDFLCFTHCSHYRIVTELNVESNSKHLRLDLVKIKSHDFRIGILRIWSLPTVAL